MNRSRRIGRVAQTVAWCLFCVASMTGACHAQDLGDLLSDELFQLEELHAAEVGATLAVHGRIALDLGQVQSIHAKNMERVAIGEPDVADVVIVNQDELLVKAQRSGATTLIVWDATGQTAWDIVVTDRRPEEQAGQLERLIIAEGFERLSVLREGEELFLSGRVRDEAEWDRLLQLLEPFPGVINLVERPIVAEQLPTMIEIEVQIIELTKSADRRLGIEWSTATLITETAFSAPDLTEALAHRVGDVLRVGSLTRAVSDTGFQMLLNHLMQEGKARLLAATHLTTSSGKPATSFIGGEIPFISVSTVGIGSGTAQQQIEFKDVGVKLTITPTISNDLQRIAMVLESEVSTLDPANGITVSGVVVPAFKTRRADTEVVGGPEDTIAIAGLVQNEESFDVTKVPGFSKIPLLGWLFKSKQFQLGQTELVTLVTPRLVTPYRAAAEPAQTMEMPHAIAEMFPVAPRDERAIAGDSDLITTAQQPITLPSASAIRTARATGPAAAEAIIPPTGGAMTDRDQRTATSLDLAIAYAQQIQQHVAAGLRGEQTEDTPGFVRLKVQIDATGRLLNLMVSTSSGNRVLERAALAAVQAQAPFPAFPSALTDHDLWLEFPVVFQSQLPGGLTSQATHW